MFLNMVANRADKGNLNPTYFGEMMVKLRMSKDKSFAQNIPEWEESLKFTFATAGFGHFLSRYSSLMAPPDQVASLQVERELETVLSAIGRGSTKVKLEPPSGLSEGRGVGKEVIFLEYLSSMRVENAFLNPEATILVKVNGEPRLFEPEADLKRLQRQAAWQLITQSITDMPDVNWKSVELGNVYGLYSLITSHSRENDMKSAVGWGSTSLYVKLKPPLPPPKSSPRKPERVVLSEAQRVAELEAHIRQTAEPEPEPVCQSQSQCARASVPEPVPVCQSQSQSQCARASEPVPVPVCQSQSQSQSQCARASVPVPVPVCQSQSQSQCARASEPVPVCQSQSQSQCARASANASVPEPEPEPENVDRVTTSDVVVNSKKVGMHVDGDVLYTHIEHAMITSDDARMYENASLHLLPAMKRLENDARTKRDLTHVNNDVNEEMIEDENENSMRAMREHTMNVTDDQVQVCARTLMDAHERKEGEGGEGIT
jgi:hypothetical protein